MEGCDRRVHGVAILKSFSIDIFESLIDIDLGLNCSLSLFVFDDLRVVSSLLLLS